MTSATVKQAGRRSASAVSSYGALLSAVFVAAILVPLAGLLVGGDDPGKEKRRLAPLPPPPASLAELQNLPERLDAYISDHFGLRRGLIRLQSHIMGRLFGKSNTQTVVIGREGWLFFGGDQSVPLYRNDRPFAEEDLARWRDTLKRRQAWAAERGIPYLFVVAPDKHSIYPDLMPPELTKLRPRSQLDQLAEAMRQAPEVGFLDLRAPLLEAKAGGAPVYLRTDTHWNMYGSYVGYRAIMDALAGRVPGGLPRVTLGMEDFAQVAIGGGDLAEMLQYGARDEDVRPKSGSVLCAFTVAREESPTWLGKGTWLHRSHCPTASRKLMVIRDSFGDGLLPYISQGFGEVVYVFAPSLPDFARFQALIDRERPDLVIEERVERRLQNVPDANWPPAQPGPDGLRPQGPPPE
ncbi:alginate O-acetyltransferase AlgX-related protein [Azospirillum sp. B510]|uniref:alginate O-acetyltransferase AlgX-related protein n=1 Tax=Azospirillum sp. (strain B510) TaxID=137722 RepID=UPI0002D501EA|nr:hypothetical protein [Azospirillum sp. B510]